MAKDVQFTLRVDAELRAAFLAACEAQDVTAAQVLRAAMRQFLKDHPQPALPLGKKKGKRDG